MKKILSLFLCFVLLMSLCACGSQEEPQAPTQNAPTAAPTEAPATTEAAAPDIDPEDAETPTVEAPGEDPVEIVRGLIDQPIADLYAKIGQPESSDYAPSCMGDGEDGMLFYDGFIVYTYREGDVETVYDVE